MFKVMKYFNFEGKIFIVDWEYIGVCWFQFLEDKGIKFVICCWVKVYKDVVNSVVGLFYDKFVGKVWCSKIFYKAVCKCFFLNGLFLYMVVVKNFDLKAKEFVIFLVINLGWLVCVVVDVYFVCWKIEYCFKYFKFNGFCLEDINLYGKVRLKLFMVVVVFVYIFFVYEGLKIYDEVEVKIFVDGICYKVVFVF